MRTPQSTLPDPSPSRIGAWPKILFASALLATLVAAFYTVENWRGRRVWAACRQEMMMRGEQLDPRAFIPPPLADEQNFFKVFPLEVWFRKNPSDTNALTLMPRFPAGLKSIPLGWDELKDWSTLERQLMPGSEFPAEDRSISPAAALLKWFEKYDTGLRALYEGAERKSARFDVDYSRGVQMEVPNFVHARVIAQVMAAHATANLLVGKPQEAMRDLTVIHQMVVGMKSSPTLVGVMIGVAIEGLYAETVRRGLAERLWQASQWNAIEQQTQGLDFISDYNRAMRGGEMANILQFLSVAPSARLLDVLGSGGGWDKTRDIIFFKMAPRGWIDQNMNSYARLISDSMQTIDVAAGRVYPEKCPAVEDRIYREVRRTPYRYCLASCVPNCVKAVHVVAERQAQTDLNRLACALERFRSVANTYPPNLQALVPQYIPKLPLDHVTGGALQYHRPDDGRCVVYSLGWNMVDEGGGDGDWSWASP